MKNITLITSFVLFVSACATVDKSQKPDVTETITSTKTLATLSQDEQEIRAVIYSVDAKIRADYSKIHKRDFSAFNEDAYLKRLNHLETSRPRQMRTLFPKFDIKEFIPAGETFVFCGFSSELEIAFCDDANCQGTEYFEKATSGKVIDPWKSQLPLKQCSKVQ